MTESTLSATAAPFVSHEPSTENAQGRFTQSTTDASRAAELASAKIKLNSALRHFPDFPIKGIDFVDILPLFADPVIHETLLHALHLEVLKNINPKPDVIVALDARGFLFGPGLALRLGCPFAPVRKQGKLPGPCATTSYKKEYGEDFFQMQQDAVKPGQVVLIVDDIIATGKHLFSFLSNNHLGQNCEPKHVLNIFFLVGNPCHQQ
jgi:adenine phosphoribosyltransferase